MFDGKNWFVVQTVFVPDCVPRSPHGSAAKGAFPRQPSRLADATWTGTELPAPSTHFQCPNFNYSTLSGNGFSCTPLGAMHTPDSTLERGMLPPNSLPAMMPMEEPQEIRIPQVMSLPSRDECDSMMAERSVA
ncbi:hypothetical protein HUJ04_008610 [Dendroctonus ponderosae]|nr:hypothetical protein HUJ04_008610 [Dendroctonus ponderosae]